uniref:Uncharacterized protein n=1 Tax=Romanomermis culicivorax TaxID=13658 RepID=A0A915J4W3_ROMCU
MYLFGRPRFYSGIVGSDSSDTMKRCKRLSKQNTNLAIPKSITVKQTNEYLLLDSIFRLEPKARDPGAPLADAKHRKAFIGILQANWLLIKFLQANPIFNNPK